MAAFQTTPSFAETRASTAPTQAPAMASIAASEEEVTSELPMKVAEVEGANASDSSALDTPTPPLGNDWRASRLFDLGSTAEVEDRPAIMRVVVTTPIPGIGIMGSRVIPDYSRFFLQSAQEQDMEKAHIVETFGSYWVHLFGRKPRVFTFSGTLLSGKGQDWEAAWDMLYDRYIRATRCVEMGTQAQLTYGKRSIYGYVLGTGKTNDAMGDFSVGFTFSMLVTHVEWVTGAEILNAQFGVSDLDGLAEQGDLQSLDGVAAAVSARDAAAGAATAEILGGDSPAAVIDLAAENEAAIAALQG